MSRRADVMAIRVAVTGIAESQRQLAAMMARLEQMQKKSEQTGKKVAQAKSKMADQNKALRGGVDGLTSSFGALAAVLGTVAAAGFTAYRSIQAYEQLQMFRRGLTIRFGAEAAGTIERQAREHAYEVGSRMAGLMPAIGRLAGTGAVRPDEVMPLIRAFTALGLGGGADTHMIERAMTQLGQIASQGQLQGDELRQIQENLVPLRSLLDDAGIGHRVGAQGDPIRFEEIKDALLEFGKTERAAANLGIAANFASSAFNRLLDVITVDILPVMGEVLTPAAKEFADWLRKLAESVTPDEIRAFTGEVLKATKWVMEFLDQHGPALFEATKRLAYYAVRVAGTLSTLDRVLGGHLVTVALFFTGLWALVKVGTLVGTMFGWLKGWLATLLGKFPGLKTGLATIGTRLGTVGRVLLTLGKAVGLTTVKFALFGAAVYALTSWLIDRFPAVKEALKDAGDWIHREVFGGKHAEFYAGQPVAPWDLDQARRDLYADRVARGLQPLPAAQSARRSDPQRLINEAGANGLRLSY